MKVFVSAIVPAHNEEARIGAVLDVLIQSPLIHEIVIVDDGSTDATGERARAYEVRVLRNDSRQGKGQALENGSQAAKGDILFFCDADIRGLTMEMIAEVLEPVLTGKADMSIGARASKERNFRGWRYSPLLDGQRALTRSLWMRIPAFFKRGYMIEAALNHFAESYMYQLYPITQVTKEQKIGVRAGRIARYMMYAEIASARVLLALDVQRWFSFRLKSQVRASFVGHHAPARRTLQES